MRAWSAESVIIVVGLATGAIFGQLGGFVGEGSLQTIFYAFSSIGLVAASVLLALRYLSHARNLLASGFMILAVAEMIIWAGGQENSEASLAAGALFYVPALLLISLPPGLPWLARVSGALAVLPFGAHAFLYLIEQTPPDALTIAGYVLLTLTAIGLIVAVVRSPSGHPG